MQIYFIRHGESTNNALWSVTDDYHGERSPSPELSERGHLQAQLLAAHLSQPYADTAIGDDYPNQQGFGLTHIYSSMMIRAIQTALPTANALGLTLRTMPTTHEFGAVFQFEGREKRIGLAGFKKAELLARFPSIEIEHDVAEAGWSNFKVEDSAELYDRAGKALDFLINNHDDDARIAIVSHGGFYQAFMAQVIGLIPKNLYPSPERELGFAINNTAITRIVRTNTGFGILYTNSTIHLPAHLVTR